MTEWMPAATPSGAIAGGASPLSPSRARSMKAVHRRRSQRQRLRPGRVHLDDQASAVVGGGIEQVEQAAEAGAELSLPGRLTGSRGADDLLHPGDAGLERLQVALVLVGEVVVERLPVDPRAVEDRPHRGAVVAFGPGRLEHAVEDDLPL
jgi:hypothetical protein